MFLILSALYWENFAATHLLTPDTVNKSGNAFDSESYK